MWSTSTVDESAGLTHANGASGTPSWSPDGRRIVCYTAPEQEIGPLAARVTSAGSTRIVEVDVETGESRVISDGPGAKLFPRYLGASGVAYLDRRGDGALRLPGGAAGIAGPFHAPSWSPDGTRVVFSRDVSTAWPPFQPAFSRDAGFRLIRAGMFPQFTPDGARVTMADTPLAAAKNSVLIMSADGASRSVLFSDPARSVLAPVWSPDGSSLAFGLGRFFPMVQGFGAADLAVLDIKSGALRVLTDGKGERRLPELVARRPADCLPRVERYELVAADHRRAIARRYDALARLRPRELPRVVARWPPGPVHQRSRRQLRALHHRGGIERIVRLTDSPGNDAHATWSPDGQWLAFSSVRGGFKDEAALNPGSPQASGDLYVMRADGTDVRALTDNQFEEATPGWAPVRWPGAR
jgi:Tol biopolymer transport system component